MDSTLVLAARHITAELQSIFKYQNPLQYFQSVDAGTIAQSVWQHKHATRLNPAVTSANKFNPGKTAPKFEDSKLNIWRTSNEMHLDDETMELFVQSKMLPEGLDMFTYTILEKVGYNLWRGPKSGEDTVIGTPYNYIYDAGTSNGSYERPLMLTQATKGAWNTAGNAANDIAALKGLLLSRGYNPSTSLIFYPYCASTVLNSVFPVLTGGFSQITVSEFAMNQGFAGMVPQPDEWMYTAAGATPTASLWDLYAVDLSQVLIGYNLPERFQTHYVPWMRETIFQIEVGWAPYFRPRVWNDAGTDKYYKGVSRITAIAPS